MALYFPDKKLPIFFTSPVKLPIAFRSFLKSGVCWFAEKI